MLIEHTLGMERSLIDFGTGLSHRIPCTFHSVSDLVGISYAIVIGVPISPADPFGCIDSLPLWNMRHW